MRKKEIILSLEEIHRKRYETRLERLKPGLPLRRKRSFPKDPEKREAVLEWLLRITPPAENILSGKAFSERFKNNRQSHDE